MRRTLSRGVPAIAALVSLLMLIFGQDFFLVSELPRIAITPGDIVAWIKDHPWHVGIPTFALLVYLRFFNKG